MTGKNPYIRCRAYFPWRRRDRGVQGGEFFRGLAWPSLVLLVTVVLVLAFALIVVAYFDTIVSNLPGEPEVAEGPKTLYSVLAAVGLAGLIALPAKHFWDDATRRNTQQRELIASTRERVLSNRDRFYVPLKNRLEWVWSSAQTSLDIALEGDAATEGGLGAAQQDLLYRICRLQSLLEWSFENGIEFLLTTEEDTRRLELRLRSIQEEFHKLFGAGELDRQLSHVVRRNEPDVPSGTALEASQLESIEYTATEFKTKLSQAMADEAENANDVVDVAAEPGTEAALVFIGTLIDQLDETSLVRLVLLSSAAHSEIGRALKRLDAEWFGPAVRRRSERLDACLRGRAIWQRNLDEEDPELLVAITTARGHLSNETQALLGPCRFVRFQRWPYKAVPSRAAFDASGVAEFRLSISDYARLWLSDRDCVLVDTDDGSIQLRVARPS